MKKISLILLSAAAFIFSNCTQQEVAAPFNEARVLNAVMEDVDKTKSDATDDGIFTWSANDQIYVHTSEGFKVGKLVGEGGTASATFSYTLIGEETETGYAIYPYNKSHSITAEAIKVVLPTSYELGSTLRNTNAIMLASPAGEAVVADDSNTNLYKFHHLAGVMRFKFKNVPAGVDKFELSLCGAKLNGEFDVLNGQIATAATEVAAEKTTTLSFDALKEASDITLFVPIPVGTYEGALLAFYRGDEEVWSFESTKTNTVARKNLVRMPELKITSSEGSMVTYASNAASLKAAVAVGGEVVLSANIELSEILTINKSIVLDLNGHTLSYASDVAGDAMITNNGTLTVKDSGQNGKITYSYTGAPDTSYSKGNYTIMNRGTFTLEDGIVENTTAVMSHASYAINTDTGAALTVNGGKVLNLNAHAIRMTSFSAGKGQFTVNGGYIEGTRAFQIHLPGNDPSSAPEMEVMINGGELKSNEDVYNLAIYMISNGQSAENVSVKITGGTFNGNVALYKMTTTMKKDAVMVSGGTFNGPYGLYSYDEDAVAKDKITIAGGSFVSLYPLIYLNDGEAANFKLMEDTEYGFVINEGVTATLDLNGRTISHEYECTESYAMITNKGNLTIKGNGSIIFKDLSNGGGSDWGSYTIENRGTLVVENGRIEHLGTADNDFDTNIPIQNYAGTVVVNGGYISSPQFRSLRDFTAGGDITINGGTFNGQVWMQGLGNGSSKLTINGGEFGPTANDGSSVYITNSTNDVIVSVTGGKFNTKIGCADSTKAGVKGKVTGGVFTETAKTNTNKDLFAEGYIFVQNQDGTYTLTQD